MTLIFRDRTVERRRATALRHFRGMVEHVQVLTGADFLSAVLASVVDRVGRPTVVLSAYPANSTVIDYGDPYQPRRCSFWYGDVHVITGNDTSWVLGVGTPAPHHFPVLGYFRADIVCASVSNHRLERAYAEGFSRFLWSHLGQHGRFLRLAPFVALKSGRVIANRSNVSVALSG